MLVTSVFGRVRGYWFREGYVRTSGRQFGVGRLEDLFVHLTNDAIQVESPEYGLHEPANKLSYAQIEAYLRGDWPRVLAGMREIGRECLEAAGPRLCLREGVAFELLGLDFMVDSGCKPWLIEVNTNPSLEACCPNQGRLVSRVVDQVLKLAVDPCFRLHSREEAALDCELIYQL